LARSILDIGCGTGQFLKLVRESVPVTTCWGLEIDPEAAEAARGHLDRVICGDVVVEGVRLPDKAFDVIVMNDVLEHLYDPAAVLRELRPKLRASGVIVASLPNVRFILNVRDFVWRGDWAYTSAGILDRTHVRFFTRKSMERMFQEAGYRVNLLQGINRIKSYKFTLLNAVTMGLLEDMRYVQFAIVADPLSSATPVVRAAGFQRG
jgi:2-polyprenyl-3-methyl-5-hydroxy-6-metoxy-1,4-benzoquinol methylase